MRQPNPSTPVSRHRDAPKPCVSTTLAFFFAQNAFDAAQVLHNCVVFISARRAKALPFHTWRKQDENMVAHDISSEYVAAVCRMTDGELDPDHSEKFFAADQTEAIRKANEWVTGMLVAEPSWLHVTLDGVSILTKRIKLSNARRSSERMRAPFASPAGRRDRLSIRQMEQDASALKGLVNGANNVANCRILSDIGMRPRSRAAIDCEG